MGSGDRWRWTGGILVAAAIAILEATWQLSTRHRMWNTAYALILVGLCIAAVPTLRERRAHVSASRAPHGGDSGPVVGEREIDVRTEAEAGVALEVPGVAGLEVGGPVLAVDDVEVLSE